MAATARDLSNAPSVITLRGVNKWFGQFHVLSDINLDVKEGETMRLHYRVLFYDGERSASDIAAIAKAYGATD